MSTINDALMPASNQPTDGEHPATDGATNPTSPTATGSASATGSTATATGNAATTDKASATGSAISADTADANITPIGSTSDAAADNTSVTGSAATTDKASATGSTVSDVSATDSDTSANANVTATGSTTAFSTHSTRALRDHRPDDAHSTGVGDAGRWSTRRIAMYALFVALAMAVSFLEFPLMPAAPWLKYDPSGVVCLVAGFAFGPSAAAIVSVLGFLPHLFTNPWGTLMAVLVALALSVPAALIYRRRRTRASALVGILVGALIALAVAIGANLVITPMYAYMSMADVAKLIVPVLLPFNLIKFALNGVITFLIYKPISTLLNRGQR